MNNKPLQNYIEEEIKLFNEKFVEESVFKDHIGWTPEMNIGSADDVKDFLSQSLHRIAKITAEEIVPEKGNYSCYECGSEGYDTAISDLQTKIKEFGI